MRKDMGGIIIDRPRRGAGPRVPRARLDDDALPARAGHRRLREIHGARTKEPSDRLAPLKRYLMKQAGRPWAKVYAEICAGAGGETKRRHLREHLADFVVMKVAIGRRGEWLNGNSGANARWRDAYWAQPLYVDPADGLLKRSDRLWRKRGIDPAPHWLRRRPEG